MSTFRTIRSHDLSDGTTVRKVSYDQKWHHVGADGRVGYKRITPQKAVGLLRKLGR